MIFIIPIILGAVAVATAGAGVAAGVDGISKTDKANKIGKAAQRLYDNKVKIYKKELQFTNELAGQYGNFQIQIKRQTIRRFVDLLKTIERKTSTTDYLKFLEGLEGSLPQQIQEYETAVLEAERFAKAGIQAAGGAYAAGQGAVTLVGLFGTASTGTAISGLSGAAAWNATLAWLGGGSLAVGGGGMALGSLVLGGITIGPALLIGGFVLGGEGEKALTKARRYEAKVNTEIEKLKTSESNLSKIRQRLHEFKCILEFLNDRAVELFPKLESRLYRGNFDLEKEENFRELQEIYLYVKAIAEILKTPALDPDGNLNPGGEVITAKYRTIIC